MRSFGAVALGFTLIISTEFLAVHSARSRQRSGPIRSVPVGADVKRDINFDCPEEFGYYPHPTDCTLYYVCVFGGALLESCTGGLMYSHELQTCDWPRNVGCEVTSAIGGGELERLSDTDPPPRSPPPRRTAPPPPPPPPPRAQPKPVVTSRGQPKFIREEYEKQQQLYEEVDDLPPAEEIESDRQQRVYRGQPSTIGQVQKDRDGYISQNSGRTLNSNIIPASIDNGKVGSFSIGTVEERRKASVTAAPQSYSKIYNKVNDSVYDTKFHIDSKNGDKIDTNKTKKLRVKRELTEKMLSLSDFHKPPESKRENNNSYAVTFNDFYTTTEEITTEQNNHTITVADVYMTDNISKRENTHDTIVSDKNLTVTNKFSDRSDKKDEIEDDLDLAWTTDDNVDHSGDENERGKRQIRFYLRNSNKNIGKVWSVPRPVFGDFQPYNIDVNREKIRNQIRFNDFNVNHFLGRNPGPHSSDSNSLSTAVPYNSYQTHNFQSHSPYKLNSQDLFNSRFVHNPINSANQIITKSPPISSLESIEYPFWSFKSGFYNNFPKQNSNQNQFSLQENFNSDAITQMKNRLPIQDSSHLSSTVVTGKPVLTVTSPHAKNQIYSLQNNSHAKLQKNKSPNANFKVNHKQVQSDKEYDITEEDNENEDKTLEESYEDSEEGDKHYKLNFPKPPYEFNHPSNKYAELENPFANPNFDFEAFLDKLRNDHYETVGVTTPRPKIIENILKIIGPPKDSTTASYPNSELRTTTLHYKGMSTPRPFTVPSNSYIKNNQQNSLLSFAKPTVQSEQLRIQLLNHPSYNLQSHPQQFFNENILSQPPLQNPSTSAYPAKPKIKPPNFSDDRQLPINYNFNRPINIAVTPVLSDTKPKSNLELTQTITRKPNLVIESNTDESFTFLTPKNKYIGKPEKIISLQPYLLPTDKPYQVPSIKSSNSYTSIIQTTSRPLTTLANEQLSSLQQYWRNKGFSSSQSIIDTSERPKAVTELPKRENLFSQNVSQSQQMPVQNQNNYVSQLKYPSTFEYRTPVTQLPPKRKLIPKPSPEMNDYYYDDDESEQYYNAPKVKPKYMPISEVMPQRPPMAQNYKEYDDSEESKETTNLNLQHTSSRQPTKLNTEMPNSVTKSYNDVSVSIKPSVKYVDNYNTEKILIPGMVEVATTVPTISKFKNIHQPVRNRTIHLKPSQYENGPYTVKPPKYLNQTTLRSYTLRHRLAKPTTEKDAVGQTEDVKQNRGKMRHQNLVAHIKNTTPRNNKVTHYNKLKHTEKPISLEPTENATPISYSASPSPKMLYNSSLSYNADQYDPYYAVYDEDGELYKDTDYVQQYNTGSIRPAVQQTYRGTPPPPTPSRRPIETFVKPVSSDIEYDDALIQGQINNPSQYQTAIHHSTRGEGNELGYDIPTSETTPAYEATPLSTTPSTTSTSTTTTTQRSTIALLTEAMTTSRYTTRSSTDEHPLPDPEFLLDQNPYDGSSSSIPSTVPSLINFSSLAKPFEKTVNSYTRLKETLASTETLPKLRTRINVTNNNKDFGKSEQTTSNQNNTNVLSLTTGFSIRLNPNNTKNPYTLTVLTRPFENKVKQHISRSDRNNANKNHPYSRYHYNTDDYYQDTSIESDIQTKYDSESIEDSRKNYESSEIVNEENDIPIIDTPFVQEQSTPKSLIKSKTAFPINTTQKYAIKSVIKRPFTFKTNYEEKQSSTENVIDTEAQSNDDVKDIGLNVENPQLTTSNKEVIKINNYPNDIENPLNEPTVSPYETLNNLRNSYRKNEGSIRNFTTNTPFSTVKNKLNISQKKYFNKLAEPETTSNPLYYTYRVEDEIIPEHTTEILSGKVKNVIRAFFDNIRSDQDHVKTPKQTQTVSYSTTTYPTVLEEKVINIGFHKKTPKYNNEKPFKSNVKRIQIVTEPSINNQFVSPPQNRFFDYNYHLKNDFLTTTTTPTITTGVSQDNYETTSMMQESSTNNGFGKSSIRDSFKQKIASSTINPDDKGSIKFKKILDNALITDQNSYDSVNNNELNKDTSTSTDSTKTSTTTIEHRPTNKLVTELITTTSTVQPTTPTKSTTKSYSFPTRASRVNPAIKLAATNPGGGRRSYQSSSNCSSDNSLQENTKCDEIKFQRPFATRGRGSAHYSTASVTEAAPPQPVNRGTPPTRSRPTLKPSTAIVSKATEQVDIYVHPPRRPSAVYPQPTPDKTAAKCRKDVCLLPDCFCGGRDIPGDMPVESIPQIVLLTFDDSVNDLNKGLYADLFEKGRVNPNGCPISATFYVSHEWTDYSQVQNLYAAGHEMASHTVSHSFGEQFSQKKWNREVAGQREILAAYGGVKLEDVRGMRAPFLSVGGNKMFKMLYDSNFTYDSSLPVYENKPPSWPYTLDYKLFHDCMIPPCPTKSYPGVWEVPMVMWQDLNGGRCSMGDACANPGDADGVYKMILKNFDRHYTSNRAPFGLYYHAAYFTQPHHKEGFIKFLDFINAMPDVWIVTNWQALQWVRDPTPISRINNFQPFQCNYQDRPKKCNNPKVCNLWHKSGVRYMRTCQPCPEIYPWTGKSGIRSSRVDNDVE